MKRILMRKDAFWPVLVVFLPFAAGYHLSYLFRTINATIAPDLVAELGLHAGFLGLLTSVYFLSFAAVQLPLGVLLDRFGPRRVQAPLMIVAAAGALVFALGAHPWTLLTGRALIGVGVAGALMSGLKALAEWFPKERLSLLNGWLIMLGTTGAIMATEPSAALLGTIGWRGLFFGLAAASAAVGFVVLVATPEAAQRTGGAGQRATRAPGLREIYRDWRFLRLAPLSAACISTAWAIQGLWAARWLADVEHFGVQQINLDLFAMACALSVGAGVLGTAADWLRRKGVPLTVTFALAVLAFVMVETAIIVRVPAPAHALWAAVAAFGAMTVLSFAILGEFFPKESVGRANAALNILHIGGAFILQSAIGFVVDCWPADAAGHYPDIAYQTALALPVGLQLIALLWFGHSALVPRPEMPDTAAPVAVSDPAAK